MDALKLIWSHRYAEAATEARRQLAVNPDNLAAVGHLALALRALERYEDALPLYERIDGHERADKVARGRPGRREDMSCIHWIRGDRSGALSLMRELVEGILDGSIEYADLAGGVEQGLLLYYMGVTAHDLEASSFAFKYLRNRAGRSAIKHWPGPVARYYLGQIEFPEVLSAATGTGDIHRAITVARDDLLSRRQLCVALFHDGVRSRANGAEHHCQARMLQCYELENPLIEAEWYLARFEVRHAGVGSQTSAES